MAKMTSRERRDEDNRKMWSSPVAALTTAETLALATAFKKKAVRRMKGFYEESLRIDKKLPEMLEKAAACGFVIDKIEANTYLTSQLLNYRRKTKNVSFVIAAHRDAYKMEGTISITPASMQLELRCDALKTVTTKSGWHLPLFKMTYYRTLVVHDNYLAALVGGANPHARKYTTSTSGAVIDHTDVAEELTF